MDRVLEMVRKEVWQLRRDRQMLPFLFAVPVIQLVLFGFAVSTDIKHVPVAVCDMDRSRTTRELVRALDSSEYVDVRGRLERVNDADRWLDTGAATAVLILPPGLERKISAGRPATLQVLMDGTDPTTGSVAMGYLVRFFESQSQRWSLQAVQRAGRGVLGPSIRAETRFWYNPTLRSVVFMVPGAMAAIIGMAATIATALAIVRERETGTMEQLIVTPLRSWELMLGKTLPFLGIGLVNVTFVLAANALIFRVPLIGSVALLYAMAALFLVSSLSVGLLISTVSRTQQQAILTAFFFLMPNFLLSGFIFPIENMPAVLQWLTTLIPLRYFLVIVRGIFLKGSTLPDLLPQIWPMAVLSTAFLLLAVWRFRKRVE